MEKNITLLTLPFICFLILSCSMETVRDNMLVEGENGFNFVESKAQWKDLKKKNGNSYEYTIREQSWTGVGSDTRILVTRGKVTARYFTAFQMSDEDGSIEYTGGYEEVDKKDIGTHEEGAPPINIDGLYQTCLSKYLVVDPDSNTVYFDTNEEGVISLCGYVPIGCVDDCFEGINMSHFAWRK
jgi:hypothetical protein